MDTEGKQKFSVSLPLVIRNIQNNKRKVPQFWEKSKFCYPRGINPGKANESLERNLFSVMLSSPLRMVVT